MLVWVGFFEVVFRFVFGVSGGRKTVFNMAIFDLFLYHDVWAMNRGGWVVFHVDFFSNVWFDLFGHDFVPQLYYEFVWNCLAFFVVIICILS